MEVAVNPACTHIAIKDWAEDDQPREKLISKGTTALSDAELLAILLNEGHKQKSAVTLAQEVLRTASHNLSEMGKLTLQQLKTIKGIGTAKAAKIIAAMELARRRQAGHMLERKTIRQGRDAALYFKPLLGDASLESFHVLFLNHACRVLQHRCVSIGGITGTIVDPKVIFREALETGATQIILCHNHPSGNLRPSNADIQVTEKLKAAGRLFDISILDHIIVSEAGYCSMVEDGFLI
ncbi:RadC family protein [Chitinophaga rhizophila]|uniref:DNA repair protein RadC n=1 Tax=Chitinophaga rhizophila TaxID=2866212 RepID=A0ABS7GC36_9BACT|nr:DNA repair protein RadC [Chitinophaga rhizophila]MBW8684374.1 DNA repair protein RadC [Chitinophaga rhizophila]